MEKSNKVVGILKSYSLLLALILFIIIVSIAQPMFMTADNLMNIMRQISALGIASLGLTVVIIAGYMDLSIAGTISLMGVIIVSLQDKISLFPSILIVLAAGAVIGLINSVVILLVRAGNGESLMISYGVSAVLTTAALLYSNGFSMRAPSDSALRMIGQSNLGPIATPTLIFFVIAVAMEFMLKKTRSGRSIQLLGCNQEASWLSAVPTKFYICLSYVISGVLAAAAAVVLSSRTMSALPTMGNGYEMDAIMAIVIGGTSLKGGRGSAIKTMLGVFLVGVMENALNVIGFSANVQYIIRGCIMVLAIWLDSKSTG